MIAITSSAKHLSSADAARIVAACSTQLSRDVAPAWGLVPNACELVADPKSIPAGTPTIAIVDVCDDPEALAYHLESTTGAISGIVGVDTILADGGTILEGGVSVSGALSHELCETVKDPFCDAYVLAPDGRLYALELCDPVQDESYAIDGVAVSNFVGAHWFDDQPPPGAKFDFLGSLHRPFSLSRGGYAVVMHASRTTQIGGMRPSWKPKAGGRAARRLAHGEHHGAMALDESTLAALRAATRPNSNSRVFLDAAIERARGVLRNA